jgi:hypothetical protein
VDDPTKRMQKGARARTAAEQRSWPRIFDGLFERYRMLVPGMPARAAAPLAPARRSSKVTV